jgi:5-hydroxyisourate hydrolase-like protein (transthyretin family)
MEKERMNKALTVAVIAATFLATFTFLSLPQKAAASETMVVGVCYANSASAFINKDAALMHEAGITIVRLMFHPYALSNQLPKLVPAIINAKIAVLGVLYNEELLAANNINGWADYVYKTVSTYKNYVKVWEVWNEPDWNTGFAPDGQVGSVSKYVQWLKAAYPKIKQADPTCRVIGGSISVVQDNTLTWLSKMYDNGARTYMDVLSVHPYSNGSPLPPAMTSGGKAFWRAQDARTIMVQRGDTDKLMWFTEIGWRTSGSGVVVTEAVQAQYIKDALTYAKTNWSWLETFILYSWQDGGGYNFGLLRSDGSRKPSFYAVKTFNTASPPTTSMITVTTPDGGQNWLRGTVHTITWTSTGSPGANVKIELLKAGVVVGVVSSSTANDGSYSWTISSTQTVGTDYKIRITSTSITSITDSSNNNFAITASATSTITVTTPDGGQNWLRGTVHTITWTSTGSPGANVKIELLKAGVVVGVVSSSTANDGSYSWTISSTQTVGTDYKIRITSTSITSITDSSNNNFAITG